MQRIKDAATFAWRNHPGCFADERIEKAGQRLGERLQHWKINNFPEQEQNKVASFSKDDGQQRLLFVASALHDVGGHSRLLLRYITSEEQTKKLLVITDQKKEFICEQIINLCKQKEIGLLFLNALDLETRAIALAGLHTMADFVFCFTHPNDPVPLVAFSQNRDSPVLFNNHAHFWYGIGTSVADICVSNTDSFKDHAIHYRYGRINYRLHFPQKPYFNKVEKEDKIEAAKRLEIPFGSTVLLSAGTKEKYIGGDEYDFFRTASKVLDRYQDTFMIVAGVDQMDRSSSYNKIMNHPRFRLYGHCDLKPLYQAADIFMESFPISSLGALQESVLYGGACPFFMYGSDKNLFSYRAVKNFDSFYEFYSNTENEYINKLGILLEQFEQKSDSIIKEVYQYISDQEKYAGPAVRKLYAKASELRHSPIFPEKTEWDSSNYSVLLAEASPPFSMARSAFMEVPIREFAIIIYKLCLSGNLTIPEVSTIVKERLKVKVSCFTM